MLSDTDLKDILSSAEAVIEAYKQKAGGRATVGDILCDLKHYCREKGIDFDEEMSYAERHYEWEPKQGEG